MADADDCADPDALNADFDTNDYTFDAFDVNADVESFDAVADAESDADDVFADSKAVAVADPDANVLIAKAAIADTNAADADDDENCAANSDA